MDGLTINCWTCTRNLVQPSRKNFSDYSEIDYATSRTVICVLTTWTLWDTQIRALLNVLKITFCTYLFSGSERTVRSHRCHRPHVVHACVAQRREKCIVFRYSYGRAQRVCVPWRLFYSVFVAAVHRLVGFY